jgi:hypothetical protein
MASPMDYMVKAPEAGTDLLYIQWAVGATGAVGAIQGQGGSRMKEFRRISAANPLPVVRTGVGVYDIFLRETWLALLEAYGFTIGAIAAASGVYGKPTTNNVTSTTAPKVTMTFVRIDTGVAAEITNGDIACVKLALKKFKPV